MDADVSEFTTPPLPVRMVNEYVYCPRLAYMEWVQGEWAASADTVEGQWVHRRVNQPEGSLPTAQEEMHFQTKSVDLVSTTLGIVGKLDLVEGENGQVWPVEYKKSKRPHVAQQAYDPERVQLCAQGLLLQEHGFSCSEGILYFAASRERVVVKFDDTLVQLTHSAIHHLRELAQQGHIPPPLMDSPKCPRCSLVGICLPDETNYLSHSGETIRPLGVADDNALPLIIQENLAKVAKSGDSLVVSLEGETLQEVGMRRISQVILMGNVQMTTPCIHALLRQEIPIAWHSASGWFLGYTASMGHKNVELRTRQYQASFDESQCLTIAKSLIKDKILNCRTLLRRNWHRTTQQADELLIQLKGLVKDCEEAPSLESLLGVEGTAGRIYFSAFNNMLRQSETSIPFQFVHRNRRPPTDPVNAMLSFAYAVLARQWTTTLVSVGFDPYRGIYHQPRYGRPSLALDLMEPFRPLVADSAVITAINNDEVRPEDFRYAANGVFLESAGRKRFIAVLERRLDQEITHPVFGYRVSYRRLFEVQARLFGRYLLGELATPPSFVTR
ncbi:MAG: CRISPR-associated endonuclease Cas1 [Magnetococcales bacterium]|nr:CRISPR-associated endonuclease Cas1 [Magnetococcales bacterium]